MKTTAQLLHTFIDALSRTGADPYADLAAAIGCPRMEVTRWCTGKREPNHGRAQAVERWTGWSVLAEWWVR